MPGEVSPRAHRTQKKSQPAGSKNKREPHLFPAVIAESRKFVGPASHQFLAAKKFKSA